jgi:hypothetical protein
MSSAATPRSDAMAGAAVTRIVASRFSMNIAAATIQAAGEA